MVTNSFFNMLQGICQREEVLNGAEIEENRQGINMCRMKEGN
jgi:hypothetical protein